MQWRNSGLLGTSWYWLLGGFNGPFAQTIEHKHAHCALKKLPLGFRLEFDASSWSRTTIATSAAWGHETEVSELSVTAPGTLPSCLASHTVPPDLRGFIMVMILFLLSPKDIKEIFVLRLMLAIIRLIEQRVGDMWFSQCIKWEISNCFLLLLFSSRICWSGI